MGLPLKNWKEDRTRTNKTGFSNNSSRSMSSPSFIEFGQPPFPRSDTLSHSGPLKDPKCWSGRHLNLRPPAQQCGALPTGLSVGGMMFLICNEYMVVFQEIRKNFVLPSQEGLETGLRDRGWWKKSINCSLFFISSANIINNKRRYSWWT